LGSPMTIGRRSDCQLVLHDLSVSRQHASVYLSREGWVIEDLHSKGGTFINRNQITRIVLREGDSIQIGKSTFVFHP
jgi:pSer/pThr/pTyr-binding forkhead associated (FHA) protein